MHELRAFAQRAQSTSESVDTTASQAERATVPLAQLVGSKGSTHQTCPVVIRRADEDMTNLVGEHAPERTRQIRIRHESSHCSHARRSARQDTLGRIDRDTNRSPARRIRSRRQAAEDRRRCDPQAPLELALEIRVDRHAISCRFRINSVVAPFEPNTIRSPNGFSLGFQLACKPSGCQRSVDPQPNLDLEDLADIRMDH